MTRPLWHALVWLAWSSGHPDAACALWERSGLWRLRPRRTAGQRLGLLGLWLLSAVAILAACGLVLVTVGPRLLPFQTYAVLSGSMRPTVPVGSIVVLAPAAADDLVVGDVITFARPDRPGEFVTHRIVRVENDGTGLLLVTKGDANPVEDAWRVPQRGSGWRSVGSIPFLGYVLAVVQSPIGKVLLLLAPALALAFWTLVELWHPAPRPRLRTAPA